MSSFGIRQETEYLASPPLMLFGSKMFAKEIRHGITTLVALEILKNAAREGVASRCVFQHGDAKQLDFPDESFDVVISNYVYHNVMGADMQKLLLESLRVLKKGGVFALNDDMKPKMYGDMEGFAQKLRDMGYEEVRLVDTAQEAFGSHRRAAMMMLGSPRLLVGRK